MTTKHPAVDPDALDDDAGPDPGGSLAMTARRPLLEPEDALEVELTVQTRIDSDDSCAQLTLERVRPLSQPGDELDEPEPAPEADEDEPPPLDSVPDVPGLSGRAVSAGGSTTEPTALARSSSRGVEGRPMAHVSAAEHGLLAAIAEGHEPSRLVYADWLARRGEVARAEFLRLDHALAAMSPTDPRFARMLQRLRELAQRLGVDWRSRVARSSIEGCAAARGGCPGAWAALVADRHDVRTCGACGEPVYYCATIELAQDRVQRGQRVAIDVTCVRWPGDLGLRCAACNGHMPADTRFCPHCGRPQQP